MSGSRVQIVAAAACCILAFLPAAIAKPPDTTHVSGDIVSSGTLALNGRYQGLANLAGIAFESFWHSGNITANFSVTGAHIQILSDPLAKARTSRESPVGQGAAYAPEPPEQKNEDFAFTGTVEIRNEQIISAVRFLPPTEHQAIRLQLDETGKQSIEIPDHRYEFTLQGTNEAPRHYAPYEQAGRWNHEQADTRSYTGEFAILAYGSSVALGGDRVIHTGIYPHQGTEFSDPLGYSTTGYYDRIAVLITAPSTAIHLQQDRGGLWNPLLESLEGHYDGDIAFADVGSTSVDARFVNKELGLVQTIGDFKFQGRYGAPSSQWKLDGEASYLGIDGVAVFGTREWLPALGALAGFSLLAWLVASSSSVAKGIRFFLLRNSRAQPLEHPTRVQLLKLIREVPGIGAPQLMQTVGLRRSSLNFHAQILADADLIKVYSHGHRQHFEPAYPLGASDRIVQNALADSRHPIRKSIIEILGQAATPMDADSIRKALGLHGSPVPKTSLFSYHMRRMEADGVLLRSRTGRTTLWALHPRLAGPSNPASIALPWIRTPETQSRTTHPGDA
ncbi:MAG TPA: hypothetical protein VM286_04815 [Candidatus Thermoplasmatota archaeon]|nr:hypothetical protein [Candidatus Thermoplasmatota archaeon]